VKVTLRTAVNKQMENRSLRRGALQCLAKAGASIPTLLSFSGHSQVNTLKRYLDFGRLGAMEDLKKATPFLDLLTAQNQAAGASS
jgi:hypothetical protein